MCCKYNVLIFWARGCEMALLSSSSRKRVRYNLHITFNSYEEKEAFVVKLKITRQCLTPSGRHPMDNYRIMLAMFEVVKQQGGASLQWRC